MSTRNIVWLQVWFFIGLPVIAEVLNATLGLPGVFLYVFLFAIWSWEWFAFAHYRYCRQEELLHVLRTAAATHAPVETVLRAYLADRPKDEWYHVWAFGLLFFVFPGYYWMHLSRSFDSRVTLLLALLESGVTLDRALQFVPGVVSRQTALAVTVGRFSGQQAQALQRLPEGRLGPQWLELAPRLWYPVMILMVLMTIAVFLLIFIIPRFEKMFADFHLQLPAITQTFISVGRWLARSPWISPLMGLLLLIVFNLLLFSSYVKWYFPLVNRFYRMHARGQFLQTLGLMLETARPLPEILDHVSGSGLLPRLVARRVDFLAFDLSEGQPLAQSLTRHGLATASMRALIEAAERAHNLPWALQELGDTLIRGSSRLSYRLAAVLFPVSIFACACLIAGVAVALFSPLVAVMEGLHGK
jgi:type II secretory pathway component PulF